MGLGRLTPGAGRRLALVLAALAWTTADTAHAAFPGANGRLAFETLSSGISTIGADGTDVTALGVYGDRPSWSPDGTRIAFAGYEEDSPYRDIFVMDADGSDVQRLTATSDDDTDPAFSPDGSKIVFSRADVGQQLWVMNADGSGQQQLHTSASLDADPAWSPDGTKIAFSGYLNGDYEVDVMNANGSGATQLTSGAGWNYDPDWSPDGSAIAFTTDRNGITQIFTVGPGGGTETPVTTTGDSFGAAWAPDGTRIAFASIRQGSDVYTIKPDGTDETAVTSPGGESESYPSWQPLPGDTTGPTLAPTVSPSPLRVGQTGATASANATDAGSGVASQSCGAIDTSTAGDHTVTCTATDNAGNTTDETIHYTVEYRMLGFLAPAANARFRVGQTIPVKVALADVDGVRIPDAEAAALAADGRLTVSATGAQTLAESAMRYDAAKDQFVFTWRLARRGAGDATLTAVVHYPGTTDTTRLSETITITG